MEGVPSNNPSAGRCGCRGGSAPSLRSGGSRSVRGKCWTRGAAQRRGTGSAAGSVREAGSRAFGTESRGAVRCSPRALDPVGSGGKFRATAPKRPGNRRTAGGAGGCVSERLRAPQLWVPQCLGLGSRFLPTLPGPTNCSPSVSPKTSKPFGPLWEMGRPGQPRPAQPWSPRHSPSRAVEQWEAGAGIRGCRHLASPPPIWRARSTPGNWKTRGEAASQ